MKESVKTGYGFISGCLQKIFGSKIYPFFTAGVYLLCYYLGWDLPAIYYTGISIILIALFCDDMTPMFTPLIFLNIIVSYKNSPSPGAGHSDFYSTPAVLGQVIAVISIAALAVIVRLILTICRKKFRPTPILFGLCAFAVVLLLNGVAYEGYKLSDLMYGGFLAAIFLGVYAVLKDNIKYGEKTCENIAFAFIALSVVLAVEMIVVYCTREGLFTANGINRGKITFGWGVYNTMGMLLMLCLPAATYLAGRYKYGYGFTIYSVFLMVLIMLTMSRQAMIFSLVLYPVCIFQLLWKGKNRLLNIFVLAAFAIIAAIIIACKYDEIKKWLSLLFSNMIVDGMPNGSGRMTLYKTAISDFMKNPAFGVGFFGIGLPNYPQDPVIGLSIMPYLYHDTFMICLGMCGIFGLLAYLVHRVQTLINFFTDITVNRSYIATTILAMLLVSLADNHIFYILPTFAYTALVSVLVASHKNAGKGLKPLRRMGKGGAN